MGAGIPVSSSVHEQELSVGIPISSSTHEREMSSPMMVSAHESEDRHGVVLPAETNNPDPHNFEVTESLQVGAYVCAKVNYPNATTYEGNKILLLGGIKIEKLMEMDVLDPHFFHDGLVVARFRPDEEGWADAQALAELKSIQQQLH